MASLYAPFVLHHSPLRQNAPVALDPVEIVFVSGFAEPAHHHTSSHVYVSRPTYCLRGPGLFHVMSFLNRKTFVCSQLWRPTCAYGLANEHAGNRWPWWCLSVIMGWGGQLGATGTMMTGHKDHLWLPGPGAALCVPSCLCCKGQRRSMTPEPPLLRLPIKLRARPVPFFQCLLTVTLAQRWRCVLLPVPKPV